MRNRLNTIIQYKTKKEISKVENAFCKLITSIFKFFFFANDTMNWWQAIILGILQGATEFLPISSSGHLLLLQKLGVGQQSLFFNIMLHVGTLVAVLVALRGDILSLVKKPFQKYNGYLVLACVPTVILAFVFEKLCPTLIDGTMLGAGFCLTAVLLYASEHFKISQSPFLDSKKALLSGVLQGIAVLPGVSRSGATISSLRLFGVEKGDASRFSFLLSIPIIVGSALYESVDLLLGKEALSVDVLPLVLGVLFSFLSGLVAIKLFLKLLEKHSLLPFAIYTLLLGIVLSILPLFGVYI